MKEMKWGTIILAGIVAILFSACKPVISYTVTFDSDGGSEIAAVSVLDGETVEKPADPEKEGYTFDGWYLNDNAYDFTSPVKTDITLKAKWVLIEEEAVYYTVSFDSDGGSEVASIEVKEGEALSRPTSPKKQGYKFTGWYIDDKAYDFSSPVNSNFTLKAKWEIPVYFKVTFDTDGADAIDSQTVEKGSLPTQPEDPVKAEYEFMGWTLDGAPYAFDKGITKDVTIKATYRSIYCSVVFNKGNGEAAKTIKVERNNKITAGDIPSGLVYAGYVFLGWTVDGNSFDFNEPITDDVTLTASWVEQGTVEICTITYDSDGGSEVSVSNVVKGNTATAPLTPIKVGFTFQGWKLNGNAFDFTTAITEDITLVATWRSTTFTVTFDSNGGSAVEAVVVLADDVVAAPTAPTRQYYRFAGWYLNNQQYNFRNPVADDITLTAKWILITYTVTFNTDGGTTIESATINAGTTVEEPRNPKKSGYTFDGWTLNGSDYDFSTIVNSNITLVAVWTALPPSAFNVTVTIQTDPTATYNDVDVTYNIQNGTLTLTASEGFSNYYWYFGSSTSYFSSSRIATKSISSWKAGTYSITLNAYNNWYEPREKTITVTISE